MIKVLYAGSFDPITKGHMNIIKQACGLFDGVVVAVMQNPNKREGLFDLDERYELVQDVCKDLDKVSVVKGNEKDTAVKIALLNDCKALIRGIRSTNDYSYEVNLRHVNKGVEHANLNTIFLMADLEYQFISSSTVRDLSEYDQDISSYVDPIVKEAILVKKLLKNRL